MTTLLGIVGTREWSGQHGPMVSIMLEFGDFKASLNAKPENVAKRTEDLMAQVGKDSSEWAFSDAGHFDDGNPKPKKVTNYPGKPVAADGGGGKREFVPRYQDTAEGFASLQASMDRRTALMQATAVCVGGFIAGGKVIDLADRYYAWLRDAERPSAAMTSLGKAGLAAEGTTSDAGESRSEVEGELPVSAEYPAPGDVPASGTSDHAAAGAAPDPSTEVSARGACLHLEGSMTVKRDGRPDVEICKKCRRVLEDVRA